MTEGRAGPGPVGDGPERHAETGGWPPPPPPVAPPGGVAGPGVPWAPGDAAYGRLGGGPPPGRGGEAYGGGRPGDRGRLGGSPAPRRVPTRGRTPVTIGLVAVNVLVYLLQVADPSLTLRYGLLPLAVEAGQYERLLTSAFLHGSLLHLASNMLALYIVGAPLERVLGTGRYLTIYLASALGGSLLALLLSPPDTLGVGASGAVFGLFGALVALRDRIGAETGGVVALIGVNLVISFLVPGISWQAHIGGLLTGVVVASLVRATLGRARPG